jgi:pilus assembly protein Flp/PilA
MNNLKQAVMNFIRDEEGLTVVEYAVAGALISLAVVGAFEALGLQVADVIGNLEAAITPQQP